MSQPSHPALIRTLLQALFIVAFIMSFILTETIITNDDKYVESSENTRAAIDELNEVLRYLFPIVPHKSRLVWSTRHRGILINQPTAKSLRPQIVTLVENKNNNNNLKSDHFFQQPKQPLAPSQTRDTQETEEQMTMANEFEEVEDDAGDDHHNNQNRFMESAMAGADTNPSHHHRSASGNRLLLLHPTSRPEHQLLDANQDQSSLTSSINQNEMVQSREHISAIYNNNNNILHNDYNYDRNNINTNNPHNHNRVINHDQHNHNQNNIDQDNQSKQIKNKMIHLVLHKLKTSKSNRLESPSKQQELTTPTLGKRGPECMRRCIMQGLLHPVQCHSLC